jgi:1-aminocyclopropane-1-carboxylate deaminase
LHESKTKLATNSSLIPLGGKLPTIETLHLSNSKSIEVLRLDEIHEALSGNKWFKLMHFVQEVVNKNHKGILSYGGPHSNHLHALAATGQLYGFKTIGVVQHQPINTPTLQDATNWGMQVLFKNKYHDTTLIDTAIKKFINEEGYLEIPMGGQLPLSVLGAASINNFIPKHIEQIFVAIGTGTTAAGIATNLLPQQQLNLISPFKNNNDIVTLLNRYTSPAHYNIMPYNLGKKFGHITTEMISFYHSFLNQFNIPLDFVYNIHIGHYLINELESLPKNALWIHTGGLQGNRSSLIKQ